MTQVIVNLTGFGYLLEITNVAGRAFLNYLKTNHLHITKKENFMIFKQDRKHIWSSNVLYIANYNIWFIANLITIPVSKYKCNNFDEWFPKFLADD